MTAAVDAEHAAGAGTRDLRATLKARLAQLRVVEGRHADWRRLRAAVEAVDRRALAVRRRGLAITLAVLGFAWALAPVWNRYGSFGLLVIVPLTIAAGVLVFAMHLSMFGGVALGLADAVGAGRRWTGRIKDGGRWAAFPSAFRGGAAFVAAAAVGTVGLRACGVPATPDTLTPPWLFVCSAGVGLVASGVNWVSRSRRETRLRADLSRLSDEAGHLLLASGRRPHGQSRPSPPGFGHAGGGRIMSPADATARLLGYLAKCDGRVSPSERRTVADLARGVLPGGPVSPEAFAAAFDAGTGLAGVDAEIATLARWCGGGEDRQDLVMLAAFRTAAADGYVSPAEADVLERVNRRACGGQFSVAEFAAKTNADSPYAVLGLTPPCSREEVRRAYRRKAAEYHPDRLGRRDIPDELRSFGEARFKAVNDAYEWIAADLQ